MMKRNRNRAMALGGILAVAGCSGGGGSTPAPATKPAQTAIHPLSSVKLTLNPTLLRHASNARRRPAFLDAGNGQGLGGGTLSLRVTSMTNDGSNLAPQATTQQIELGSTAPVQLSVPLYGPSGFIRIQEIYQAPVTAAPQLIADTESGGLASTNVSAITYSFNPGAGSEAVLVGQNGSSGAGQPITLNAVIGGVVISDTPDGSSGNAVFVPNANSDDLSFTAFNSQFVFIFPADATGGFTPSTVPGGFPNPVNITANQTFSPGFSLTPTNIPGAFVLDSSCNVNSNVVFDVIDGLGNHGSTAGSGYLNILGNFSC
jgi:hypothetical protein